MACVPPLWVTMCMLFTSISGIVTTSVLYSKGVYIPKIVYVAMFSTSGVATTASFCWTLIHWLLVRPQQSQELTFSTQQTELAYPTDRHISIDSNHEIAVAKKEHTNEVIVIIQP